MKLQEHKDVKLPQTIVIVSFEKRYCFEDCTKFVELFIKITPFQL